jgi:ATP-binding cassette subfamily B protein
VSIPVRIYWGLLVRYLAAQRGRVLLLALLLFSGIGLQLVSPQILRGFIDGARGGAAMGGLIVAALLFMGAAVLQQILYVGSTYVSEMVGWNATNALRTDLLAHALRLDMGFHNARTPGELLERVDGDVTTMANFFSRFVLQVLGNGLLLAGVLLLFAREDWRVGLVMGAFVALAVAALMRLQNLGEPSWRHARAASADFIGFLEERLSGLEDIRSSGAAPHLLGQLHGHTRELLRRYRRARVITDGTRVIARVIFACGQATALAIGAYLFYQGAATVGTVFMISYYTSLIVWPLEQLSHQLQDLQQAGAGIRRVQELREAAPTIVDGGGAELPSGPPAVEFDHVAFSYPPGQAVLHSLSFRLRPGAVLGLLGRTGAGKTTIIRLLLRLYDPTAGAVRLGGVDLRELHLAGLRRHVGVVTQDVQLFRASVRDNLTFFDRSFPDRRLLSALEEMGLGPWLRSLPAGLDTRLAAGGDALSAGEAQLLAFTRVLLRDPGLVILDEASSRLDPATERRTQLAIERLLAGRTAIIIAHKLATVRHVDEIMILDGGRIAEHGPREALAADTGSRFAGLLRLGLEEVLT